MEKCVKARLVEMTIMSQHVVNLEFAHNDKAAAIREGISLIDLL